MLPLSSCIKDILRRQTREFPGTFGAFSQRRQTYRFRRQLFWLRNHFDVYQRKHHLRRPRRNCNVLHGHHIRNLRRRYREKIRLLKLPVRVFSIVFIRSALPHDSVVFRINTSRCFSSRVSVLLCWSSWNIRQSLLRPHIRVAVPFKLCFRVFTGSIAIRVFYIVRIVFLLSACTSTSIIEIRPAQTSRSLFAPKKI